MTHDTVVRPAPRPWYFLAGVAMLVAGFLLAREIIDLRTAAQRQERTSEALELLDHAVLSLSEEFRRPRLARRLAVPVLRQARQACAGKRFDAATAELIAQGFVEVFPGSQVFAFDRLGKLVFQSGKEPRRMRETLWAGVLSVQREGGANLRDPRFQGAATFCRGSYGSLTNLADLANRDLFPRPFQDRGQMRFSWVFPEERLHGSPSVTPGVSSPGVSSPGLGGIWVILDPARLSTKGLYRKMLRRLTPLADTAMVVRRLERGTKTEAQVGSTPGAYDANCQVLAQGRRRPPRSISPETLEHLLSGRTTWTDPAGVWVARYLSQGNGRYLIAGIGRERLDGTLARARPALLACYLGLCVILGWFFWKTFWMGVPSNIGLYRQVFALFSLTTVLPLIAVLLQGADLAAESARQSRTAWEKRIQEHLVAIDRRHVEFQVERSKGLRKIERELAATLPLSASRFPKLCQEFEKVEVVMVDPRGNRMPYLKNMDAVQSQGEYPGMMCRHLAEVIEGEGRVPDPALNSGFTMFPGYQIENLLYTLFRLEKPFNRIQTRDRNLLQQPSVLYDPSASPSRAIGLISWGFDEVSFSREFVERTLAFLERSRNPQDPFRIGFASSEGRFHPAELGKSPTLRAMAERVTRFRAGETGFVNFPDGRRFLAVVSSPAELGGYLPVGLLEARPVAEIGRLTKIRLVLGLESPFPLEKEEVFALRVLTFATVLSLLLMIPMALVVSRWIVGRIVDLTAMVREIGEKRFHARVAVAADDELGDLASSFNEMARGLQEREKMSRFVSEQVLEEVKKDDQESLALGGERREVAVLFTHIHSFNDLVGRHSPSELIETLNEYFTFLNGCIAAEQGDIDKYIGDAVMAVFFAKPGAQHPAHRAFLAGRRILEAERAFNAARQEQGQFTVRTDLGIHFGPAISGKVGSRHGMIDFTVIGDTVNTAARIQGQAAAEPAPSLLLSREVLQHLPSGHGVVRLKEMTLKGKAAPITLFTSGTPAESSLA